MYRLCEGEPSQASGKAKSPQGGARPVLKKGLQRQRKQLRRLEK